MENTYNFAEAETEEDEFKFQDEEDDDDEDSGISGLRNVLHGISPF
jgi:hypothetical protein